MGWDHLSSGPCPGVLGHMARSMPRGGVKLSWFTGSNSLTSRFLSQSGTQAEVPLEGARREEATSVQGLEEKLGFVQ